MKKAVLSSLLVIVLLLVVCTVVKADSPIETGKLPADSKYVGTATVWVRVYGDAETSEFYHWTAGEVFWPGKDCFTDGVRTTRISSLESKAGYHWEKDGDTYCIVKDK